MKRQNEKYQRWKVASFILATLILIIVSYQIGYHDGFHYALERTNDIVQQFCHVKIGVLSGEFT